MNPKKQAIDIVTRAALNWANGNERCSEITEAAKILKTLNYEISPPPAGRSGKMGVLPPPRFRDGYSDRQRAEMIIQLVSERYSIPRAALLGPARTVDVAWPRQLAQYLVHQFTHLTLCAIARLFQRHAHRTILNSLRRVKDRCDTEPRDEQELFLLGSRVKEILSQT